MKTVRKIGGKKFTQTSKMYYLIFFQIVLSLLAAVLVAVEARPGYVLVPIDSLQYYQPYQMARQPSYNPVS